MLFFLSLLLALVPYAVQDFSKIHDLNGISRKTLELHLKLYEGYVKNTNHLLSILEQYSHEGKESTPQFAAIKQRLAFEFDGMRMHELYFSNLGGKGELDPSTALHQQIVKDFGSYQAWKENFINTGLIRGIGWVVLYLDPIQGRLMNLWIAEHQDKHIPGGSPILVMDVWEHAYLLDYGIDRSAYINAFFNNIDWRVVSNRYGT